MEAGFGHPCRLQQIDAARDSCNAVLDIRADFFRGKGNQVMGDVGNARKRLLAWAVDLSF
jgi:hypothetical protein